MHKQKKSVIAITALVALIAIGTWFATRPTAKKVSAPVAVPVQVINVVKEDVPRYVTGIGSVLSLQSVVIRPQVDGILTKLMVKEGQQVKTGDLLATIDDRSIRAALEQAKAQLSQSEAQLDVAQVDLKRYKLLTVDNSISKQQYDQQQALVNQLKATVQGNQASINASQVQLSYTQIRSPVTGRVGIRTVDEGNFLRVSDATGLFSVTQIDPVSVEFSLPQQMLPTLHDLLADTTPAKVNAYLGEGANGTLLGEGRLTLIDNQVAATTGTIRAKATFDNAAEKLWPGQLVTVRIQTAIDRDALKVPPQVVQRGIDQHYVYRVKDDKVEVVPVKVLYQDSNLTLISGVSAGDVLVSDGQSRLKNGTQIEVVKADATDTLADVASAPAGASK
ncbi:efflux transporter periplasmic adaptor subunit [Pseudomonas sp. Bc-h]|jgi:RND family efflux transporter MFP subunit|uniref:efflux RND transporter periplasmic adaptor subunit n=1 Tax=unclassified Pseudomonas TaxID=196821 RepID=UPI0009D9ADB8|nr:MULTISPECIES: efflux RND transporter periplasmic adaptor subunit [unclassified Pseudomonas]MDE1195505.1 efflux RND transporter periplasmic adaptor subunit [Pseudomonas sp.]OQR32507.1 efflux transporter periplasmic adaptor subunit [Pseudomonas sp. Bc-h]